MTSTSRETSFLPDGMYSFLKKRFAEIFAVLFLIFAVLSSITFYSYSPTDPSLNNASGNNVENLFGPIGAKYADICFQTVGHSIWLSVFVFLCWAWKIGRHKGIAKFWLRVLVLPVAILLASTLLANLSSLFKLTFISAGFSGFFIYDNISALIFYLISHKLPYFTLIILLAINLTSIIFLLALTRQEWFKLIKASSLSIFTIIKSILWFSKIGEKLAIKPVVYQKDSLQQNNEVVFPEKKFSSIFQYFKTILPRIYSKNISNINKNKIEPNLDSIPKVSELSNNLDSIKQQSPEASLVEKPSKLIKEGTRITKEAQTKFNLGINEIELPPLNLLSENKNKINKISDNALEQNARMLEGVLSDFGVNGEIVRVRPGPVVTLYELEPARGIKASRVVGLADDIARSMSAVSARVAVIPGQNAIGIELPNRDRETVYLRELISSSDFEASSSKLTLAIGKDIGGEPVFADLARMPHLLVAGTTGSGKSVAINSMILSLLYKLKPDECKLIMIDPKMLELSVYDNIPHLLAPVVTEPKKAVVALKWAVKEMEQRYRAMSHLNVRNIAGYNQRLSEALRKKETFNRTVQTGFDPQSGKPIFEKQQLDLKPMPYIVVVVDEMADLMLIAGKEIEASVQRLAQMARAAGIHLIMATQRPSVDVITGTIKANFPTRISFQVTSKIDSRTILGEIGAETLLGSGDMLHVQSGGKIRRVHGPFVSDKEVEKIVSFLQKQQNPEYLEEITEESEETSSIPGMPSNANESGNKDDDLYNLAIDLICREGKVSTSFIQRHLQIGYNRAARIVERMESDGIISKPNHVGKREIFARTSSEADI